MKLDSMKIDQHSLIEQSMEVAKYNTIIHSSLDLIEQSL